MAKLLFGNLVFDPSYNTASSKYTMLNLYSFRRKLIDEHDFKSLCAASAKESFYEMTEDEKNMLSNLCEQKQILSEELQREYDQKRKRILNQRLADVPVLINSISITPSFQCNFSCSYCYQRRFTNKERVLAPDDIDQIIRYVEFINGGKNYREAIASVTINGGEATLDCNMVLLKYILHRFYGNGRKLTLLTNGSRLHLIKDIIDLSKFNKIQISLDGDISVASVVNRISSSLYKQTLNGIKDASDLCPEVEITCMITRELIANFDNFFECKRQLESEPLADLILSH